MEKETKSAMKLNYGKTILTGFGFLATSIAWAIYDPYITKILNHLLNASATITGWSTALVEHFPTLVRFAEAQGENYGLSADELLASGAYSLADWNGTDISWRYVKNPYY